MSEVPRIVVKKLRGDVVEVELIAHVDMLRQIVEGGDVGRCVEKIQDEYMCGWIVKKRAELGEALDKLKKYDRAYVVDVDDKVYVYELNETAYGPGVVRLAYSTLDYLANHYWPFDDYGNAVFKMAWHLPGSG